VSEVLHTTETAQRLCVSLIERPVLDAQRVAEQHGVTTTAARTAINWMTKADVLKQANAGLQFRKWIAVDIATALDRFAERSGRRSNASATAPAMGWLSPHTMFWIATAKLNMLRPVPSSAMTGSRYKPNVDRAPRLIEVIRPATLTTRIRLLPLRVASERRCVPPPTAVTLVQRS